MKQAKILVFIVLISIIFTISCAVQQDISITLNGSGSSDLEVELQPVFVYYILDLAEAFSETESDEVDAVDIFKIDEIKKQINSRPGASVKKISNPSREVLKVSFTFSDVRKLMEPVDGKVQDIITFSSKNGVNKIHFHLEKSNYSQFAELFPVLENPVFENLAPQVDEDIIAAEYLDIIEFAMGEDGPDAVLSSFITIKVKVNGKLVSQKGGTVKDGIVLFEIPLLRVCLLNEPLDFEIAYK